MRNCIQHRIARRAIAVLFTGVFLVGGSSLMAQPKETVIGGKRFAARILTEIDNKHAFEKTSEKSHIGLKAGLAARLFKKDTGSFAEGQIELGNYGNYKKDPVGFNINKRKEWQLRTKFRLFGTTIGDRLHDAPPSVTSSEVKKKWNPFKVIKYQRKNLVHVFFMVGPVPFSARAGLAGSFELKPDFGFSAKGLEVSAKLAPTASASAFGEGGPDAILLRGGIGVSLLLIQGAAGLKAAVNFKDTKDFTFKFFAGVKALQGRVYAFVDRRKWIYFGKYKRWINKTLYETGSLNWNHEKTLCRVTFASIKNGSFKCGGSAGNPPGGGSTGGGTGHSGNGGSCGGVVDTDGPSRPQERGDCME